MSENGNKNICFPYDVGQSGTESPTSWLFIRAPTNINDSEPLMPKLYLNDGSTDFGPEVEKMIEPEYGHQRKWVDACKAGFKSKEHLSLTSSFDYAGPMTETVLMGNLAIRSYMLRDKKTKEFFARKKLLWDGDNMKITNLEAANQFVTRDYRQGFEV